MYKKILIVILITVSLILYGVGMWSLLNNKTFFKTTYIGINDREIFIPKYSFFKREAGMTVASFYSLKSVNTLKKEINDYMKEFEFFEDDTTYGYKKGDLFIQSYEISDEGLYRKIHITY